MLARGQAGSVSCCLGCRYDPNPRETVIEEDEELLEAYLLVPEGDFQPEMQSPWLLRIELDKMMMLDKRLECVEVASKIGGSYLGLVHVISSEDNADKLVLRIRLIEGAPPVYFRGRSMHAARGHTRFCGACEGSVERREVVL